VADPAHVELHREGVEGDADGPILDEPLGHLDLILGDLEAAGDPDGDLGPVELAGLVLPVIPVVCLGLQTPYVHQGLVGILHEAATAAAVQLVAVDELLLGETKQLAVPDGLLALDVAADGEGPAGAAHALVLDVGDGAVVPPVEGLR